MSTRSPLHCWGQDHRRQRDKLRQSGRRVEVVAVAWDRALLDRAGRRLHSWAGSDMSQAERKILTVRQAITDTDWDSVEGHGGFDVVIEKIVQWEQENPASNGREMIDDFRLRGSRTWRRMGGHLTKGGWLTRWLTRWRTLLTTPTLLSQRAKSSPSWSRLCPETRIGSGLARILRILCGKAHCGAAPGCPRLARRVVAPHGRGRKWRERPPPFSALVRHRGGVSGPPFGPPLNPPLGGVAPSTLIPAGRLKWESPGPGLYDSTRT